MKSIDRVEKSMTVKEAEAFCEKIPLKEGLFYDMTIQIENPIHHFLKLGLKIEDYDFQDSSRKEMLLLINMLRRIIEEVKVVIHNFIEKVVTYEKMMIDHTARSNHRKVYSSMKQLHKLYCIIIRYISIRVESTFLSISDGIPFNFKSDHKDLQKLLTMTQRIQEDTTEATFGTAIHKFLLELKFL
jgi:hypothetical protein